MLTPLGFYLMIPFGRVQNFRCLYLTKTKIKSKISHRQIKKIHVTRDIHTKSINQALLRMVWSHFNTCLICHQSVYHHLIIWFYKN